MAKQPRYMMRVTKGALAPADGFTERALRAKGYRIGEIVSVSIRKARNPRFHRLAHQFGSLLVENLDAFEGLDSHAALKRVQWEANIACDEMGVQIPGAGFGMVRIPQSLSFESMDEARFREVFAAMCRHVAKRYWPECSPEQIEQMAGCMAEEAAA